MTRILSYNILVGGARRIDQISKIISSAQPDIVGLVEATDPKVVEELAKRLDMQYVMSGRAKDVRDWQVAVLTRLPVVRTQVHNPGVLTKPVLEVCIEEPNGRQLTVFVTHLSAGFNQNWAGDHIRRSEAQELLRIMAKRRGTPQVLMGDFNALAPGDHLQASVLLRYVIEKDRLYRGQRQVQSADGHPYLNFVIPPYLRVFNPILHLIPRSRLLCALFDAAVSWYVPRGSIGLICSAGYIDCFRHMHLDERGFTCPAGAPAGRIDYIFASPELVECLKRCEVVSEGEGVRGEEASDHLPVVADFGEPIENDDVRKMNEEPMLGEPWTHPA
jgi:endonuclease/exonuclease/phosphatase family metal-dependent hydrolase